MRYFDYEAAAREAGIPDKRLTDLVEIMRREFPEDEMMLELHVLRAVMALREGRIDWEDVLSSSPIPKT